MDEWGTGLVLEDNHFGVGPAEGILVYRDLGHQRDRVLIWWGEIKLRLTVATLNFIVL